MGGLCTPTHNSSRTQIYFQNLICSKKTYVPFRAKEKIIPLYILNFFPKPMEDRFFHLV